MKESSEYLSQVIYCGGYSGDEPPLAIPNREVKLTSADGTAPPGGRVGRCRFSGARSKKFDRAPFVVLTPFVPESPRKRQRPAGPNHWGKNPPNPLGRFAPKPSPLYPALRRGRQKIRLWRHSKCRPLGNKAE